MKKILCIVGSFLFLTSLSNAQLSPQDYLSATAPDHIQQRFEKMRLTDLAYSMNKNNSFDTPLSIEHYDVDILQNETLDRVNEFTYSPGGQLRTSTTLDATLVNQDRATFNFNYFGEITSIVYEQWNGASWDFDYRYIMTYNGSGLLTMRYFENYTGTDWEFDYGDRIEYVGSETTPSVVIASSTDDNVNWQESVKVNYAYNGGVTPVLAEVVVFDQNYLNWITVEKWEVSNWGPKPFKADQFFNLHEGQNKITDNVINKTNALAIYPADFIYSSSFNYTTGVYDMVGIIESTYDQGNRTRLTINEFNGISYDSTARYTMTYHDCYGFDSYLSEDYVSPNVWTINNGNYYQGYTTSYSGACYVNAYNFFDNFSDLEPNGIRTDRWVISQATDLNSDELDMNSLFTVYPNPVKDELSISISNSNPQNSGISIQSLDGKIIYTANQVVNGQTINTQPLPSGVYFIKLILDGESAVKSFIKE
jgi:hypothetical protein